MNPSDLAKASGLSVSMIHALERGQTKGSARSAYALAQALNCTVDDIWVWEDE